MLKTIRTKVLVLAVLPAVLLTLLMSVLNVRQTQTIADAAIADFKTEFIAEKQNELRNYLALAKSALAAVRQQYADLPRAEQKQKAFDVLRKLRFDDSGNAGYVFAYDMQGVNVMHGVNASLEGKNLYGFKDPNGVPLIQELIEAAKRGGDFVQYSWRDVDKDLIRPKLGYAEMISDWNIMLGTGLWNDGINAKVNAIEVQVNKSIQQILASVLIFALIAVGIVIIIALIVARAIVRPLRHVVNAMDDIASGDGDLTKRLNEGGDEELRRLAKAFNRFADQVQDVIQQVRQSTSTLNDSSARLDELMGETIQGVHRQRDESDQVATAMTEMTTAAQEVATNAADASEAARAANHQVSDAQQILQRSINTVDGLSGQVNDGVNIIQRLGEDSEAIGSVIDVIGDIAEQTSLLALNAAIEAARAGDTGRGFAVVADEVRNLASKTQESTQQISSMIEKLQQGADKAVSQITSISSSNDSVVGETHQANEALLAISTAVARINDMNAQIASAAEEQTAVSETVKHNLERIVEITNDTAHGSELATSVTQQLNSLADDLSRKVERYRVL